jgi:hypothetical protein
MKLQIEGIYKMCFVEVGCGYINVIRLSQDVVQLQE